MSSYEIGRMMAPVLMFVGGLALLLSGRRGRRAAEAAGGATRGPRARVAFGVLLLFMSTVGTAGAELTKQLELHETTVALPQTLLGLHRDDALLGKQRAKALSMLPDNLDVSDVGAYGDGTAAVIVGAGRGRFEDPKGELAHAFPKDAIPDRLKIDGGHDVPAGDLGGYARCWTAETFGSGADICGFVSATSLVMVIDRDAPDAAAAARRALAVRQAVVSVEGTQPAPVDLPSPARTSVRVSLPAVVHGWHRQRVAAFEKVRAQFVADSRLSGLRQADMAFYLVDGRGVMAETALGRFRNAEVATRAFAGDLAKDSDGPVSRAVPASGGLTCWSVRMDGPAVTCLWLDPEAFVAVVDLDSTSVARTAAITRTLAAAVAHRS